MTPVSLLKKITSTKILFVLTTRLIRVKKADESMSDDHIESTATFATGSLDSSCDASLRFAIMAATPMTATFTATAIATIVVVEADDA